MKTDFDGNNQVKRLYLSPSEYEEGVKIAKENGIRSLFLRDRDEDEPRKNLTLDFSWLSELPDLIAIEMIIDLSAKSNINSLYALKNLKSLSYFNNYDKLPLEHEKLTSLERLYTSYSKNHLKGISTFDKLPNLKQLKLWHIKDVEDCSFLGNLPLLERLELTWSRKLQSLQGLETFRNLQSLSLQNLYTLTDVNSIYTLPNLKGIWVEGCKHINEAGKKIIDEKNIINK